MDDIHDPSGPPIVPDCISTNLRLTNGWTPYSFSAGSRETEAFLVDLERELLVHLDEMANKDTRKKHPISSGIDSFLTKLQKRPDLTVVHTDKTNTICIMKKKKYFTLVRSHLNKEAVLSNVDKIRKLHKKALSFVNKNKEITSENEFNYIKSTINAKKIPTVLLLVKDHKTVPPGTNFPTQLVVPAKTFTAVFPLFG